MKRIIWKCFVDLCFVPIFLVGLLLVDWREIQSDRISEIGMAIVLLVFIAAAIMTVRRILNEERRRSKHDNV